MFDRPSGSMVLAVWMVRPSSSLNHRARQGSRERAMEVTLVLKIARHSSGRLPV
jgi:hypothetical protein